MKSSELRNRFLDYFRDKGHKIVASASLIPSVDDPTVLFTTAGMQPLTPYLEGEKHPEGNKLCNLQKCIRTIDIDEVGDKVHLTFFEMMGYWSLGDYWKKEAIGYTYDFLTKELGFSKENLAVSCFHGDDENGIPKDDESYEIWRSLGIEKDRIAFLPRSDNFWGPVGETGLCGPDSEVFYWTGKDMAPIDFDSKNPLWVEIGNDVFMAYNKTQKGTYQKLEQRNVDFGAGFERLAMILQQKDDVYETDLFRPIIDEISKLSNKDYSQFAKDFRIIADHIKAAVFIIADGVVPSNKERGYILRRLIRRAVVKASALGIKGDICRSLSRIVFAIYQGAYNFIEDQITAELVKEETKFKKTLDAGLAMIDRHLSEMKDKVEEISTKDIFDWFQSFGIPFEVSVEEIKVKGFKVSSSVKDEFDAEFKKHQELSRTASVGMFKGGLAGGGDTMAKMHTATHLLLAALRKVLGDQVSQKGSNITEDRIRFDFSYPEKLTGDQKKEVEQLVNQQIDRDLEVREEEMTLAQAKEAGATGVFEDKYQDRVKVYSIGDFSKEICGGPHAKRSGELGYFEITKEESSSAGIRRIKAVLK